MRSLSRHSNASSVLTAALIIASVANTNASAAPGGKSLPAPPGAEWSSWIVTFKGTTNPAALSPQIAAAFGGSVARIYQHALRGFVCRGPRQAADALARSPLVRAVVPDRPVNAVAETVPSGVRRI